MLITTARHIGPSSSDPGRIKKLILLFIPTNLCNLDCHYCFVSQMKGWERDDIVFRWPVEHILEGLRPERLEGYCFMNLTAQGETLLYKDIVPLTRGLLEMGHHVEIITNASVSKRIDEILEFPEELLKRLFFKCSYHYEQIRDKPMEEIYWRNVKKIQASPCSFTIEVMPNDEIAPDIDDLCRRCREHAGAVCHATVGRNSRRNSKALLTDMTQKEYVDTWSRLHSTMFDMKMDLFGVKRREFCYAGKWSLMIDIASGEASQCYGRINTQNVFEDLSRPIRFFPVGHSCTQAFCFNGHAHLAWGMIPELDTPTYAQVRDRVCPDGSHWVKPEMREYFSHRLAESNREYTKLGRIAHTIANPFYLASRFFHDIPGVKRKTIKFYKIIRGKFE